jgi:hypothetical protein
MTPTQELLQKYTHAGKDLNFQLFALSEAQYGNQDTKQLEALVLFYVTHMRSVLDEIVALMPQEVEE